jgi:ubiquitin-like protein ATG12
MASIPETASPTDLPDEDDDHGGDMPLTMAASVVLDQLPKDAHKALETAGELDREKGIFHKEKADDSESV